MDKDATREEVFAVVLGMKEEAEENHFSPKLGFQSAMYRLILLEDRWFKTRKVKLEMLEIIEYLTDIVNEKQYVP